MPYRVQRLINCDLGSQPIGSHVRPQAASGLPKNLSFALRAAIPIH